jgi:hypothetical protein
MKFDGPFTPGAVMHGVVAPSKVNAEVAKAQRAHEGLAFDVTIEQMEPERLFSFRWHPGAVEPGVDYSAEPTTLVEFVLEEAVGGVLLMVTESGFDRIPLPRRAKAFTANEGGWSIMVKVIEEYLVLAP